MCDADRDSANRIGIIFAEWVAGAAFNFDHCDAIANRIEIFLENGDLEAKVECLIALLEMGTTHNRWYVERKFARLCGPEMPENLAKRLVVKFHISGKRQICRSIEHLEGSIDFNRNSLHPRLLAALATLCT